MVKIPACGSLDAMDPSTIVEGKWRIPPPRLFKVNSNLAIGIWEVGLGAIVHDSISETLMIMEKFQPFISNVELVEAITLYVGVSKALEASIYPLRIETNSLIMWGLLTNSS